MQIRSRLAAKAEIKVTGLAKNIATLRVGFINNLINGQRNLYYNSTRRTKYRFYSTYQAKDGPGPGRWYTAPVNCGALVATADPDSLLQFKFEIDFKDQPLAVAPLVDPNETGGTPTLHRVDGIDEFALWVAVMDASEDHLMILEGWCWEVDWSGTFSTTTRLFNGTGGSSVGAYADDVRPTVASRPIAGAIAEDGSQTW